MPVMELVDIGGLVRREQLNNRGRFGLLHGGSNPSRHTQELHPDTNGETYRPDAETVLVSVPYALRCKPLMIIAGDRGRLRGLHSQPSKGICRGSGHNVCQLPRRKIKGGIVGALRRAGSSWAYRGDESQL